MNLYDILTELFTYLMAFRLRVNAGIKTTLEEVQKDLLQIFREQEMKVRQNPALHSAYEQVRYPLVVFADEVILNSDWEYARDWEAELLERRFFESEVGGDRFFELWEEHEMSSPEVAAIYYTCLSMGFRGRYEQESEELRLIKQDIREKCPSPVKDPQAPLCPEAYSVRERRTKRLPSILRWRQIPILFLVLFGIHIILDRIVIWNYLTEPVKNISHLAATLLSTGELPPPVPSHSASTERVSPLKAPEKKFAHSDLLTPASRVGDKRTPDSSGSHKVRKKIDPRSLEPIVTAEKAKKETPLGVVKKSKSSSGYTLQLGAFSGRENAEELVQILEERGYDPHVVVEVLPSEEKLYRIQMGFYKVGEMAKARKAASDFKKKEHIEAFVINRGQ